MLTGHYLSYTKIYFSTHLITFDQRMRILKSVQISSCYYNPRVSATRLGLHVIFYNYFHTPHFIGGHFSPIHIQHYYDYIYTIAFNFLSAITAAFLLGRELS